MQQSNSIKAGIIGAAGYTGGELLRLLLRHPNAEVAFAQSRSNGGKPISCIHQDLYGETELKFSEDMTTDIDVLFLCSGYGEARTFLEKTEVPPHIKVIDLSHDFRLKEKSVLRERKFVYGLPELNRQQIQQSDSIANPGCFATALQL